MLRLFLISLIAILISGCSTIHLPAVTESHSGVVLDGKVVWHDLITDTPDATKRFYAELFGWQFEELSPGSSNPIDYTLIHHNGRLIGGMVNQTKLKTKADISQWVIMLSVKNVDSATDTLLAAGGTVYTKPTSLADRGRIAVVADPQGALFALLQTNNNDPHDTNSPDVGAFLWDELWTDDVEQATAFYKTLASYEIEDHQVTQDDKQNHRYRLLSSHNKPRVGILKNPVEKLKPIWVNYLRISNATELDNIVSRVKELGGTILLEPQDRSVGGRAALIAGPSGAGIALQTWPLTNKSDQEGSTQ